MKYDSGMTHLNKDILAAVRLMCGGDTEITEKFSPDDSSPAPLKSYLVKYYGSAVDTYGKTKYSCTPQKGMEIWFDNRILNSNGDKNLTISWALVTKFIRDNWSDVFKGTRRKTKKSVLDVLTESTNKNKTITCPNWVTGKTLTYRPQINGVHFECKAFASDFCKADNITEFLDKHCSCHEDCPYYKKGVSEKQPSPAAEDLAEAGKPKPTYKDILLEHYPNLDLGRFEDFACDVCVTCCFKDNDDNLCKFHEGSCLEHWESECLYKWRDRIKEGYLTDIEEYLIPADEKEETANVHEPPKKMSKMCQELFASNADTDTKTADLPNPPVPANAEEIASTFNYAVLSTEMGDYLKHKEQQLKNEYMNFTANCGAIFAEAQEKLAGDNHYNGLFLKWIESMGFKKSAVYRMIDVHKFYSSQIGKSKQELFAELPKSLQYEISAKSAPPELVEQVLNGDIKSHSEYIKLKKELERTQEECRMIDANSAAKDKEYQRQLDEANRRAETERKARESISENYTSLQEGYKDFKDKYTEEYYKNVELKKRIGELEKQPVDVVVQQDEKALAKKEAEIQRLKDELEKSRRDSLDDCFEKPGEIPTREILEFYETLQANAISAIKECARFIKDKIPNNLQGDAKSRFKMLEELLADCKEEMEE